MVEQDVIFRDVVQGLALHGWVHVLVHEVEPGVPLQPLQLAAEGHELGGGRNQHRLLIGEQTRVPLTPAAIA